MHFFFILFHFKLRIGCHLSLVTIKQPILNQERKKEREKEKMVSGF